MKRLLFLLIVFCLLVVSCGENGPYEAYYITYDEVDVHELPSEDSEVVLKLICINRPSSYKQEEGVPPTAFAADNAGPSPIGIRKVDESGKWGYIEESVPLILNWKGWVPLDKMLPCGTREDDEVVPTYELVEDGVIMYRHPEENDRDKVFTSKLHKGDKVLLRSSGKGWSFVSRLTYSESGKELEKFGWVRTSSLSKVESVSRAELKGKALGTMQDKTKDRRIAINFTTVLRKVFLVASILALVILLAFLIPGIRRKLWLETFLWLPACALLLFMGYYLTGAPALVYALLVVVAAYALTYPLRFAHRASTYYFPFLGVSIGGSLVVLFVLKFLSGGHLLLNLIAFVFDLAVIVLLAQWITTKVELLICPHCDFYARHPRIRTDDEGETVVKGTESWDSYDYSTKRTNFWGETVITNYYKRHYSTRYYIEHHYTRVYQCLRCGEEIRRPRTTRRLATSKELRDLNLQ